MTDKIRCFLQRNYPRPNDCVLLVMAVWFLLPFTWPTDQLSRVLSYIGDSLGISDSLRAMALYALGLVLLVSLVLKALYHCLMSGTYPQQVRLLVASVCVFCLLYPLDVLLSTATSFAFKQCGQMLFALTPFFLVMLFSDSNAATRIVKFVLVLVMVQSLCGICFYYTNQFQLVTPHFGKRTGGTFHNPNHLYTVCVVCIPFYLAWAQTQTQSWRKLALGPVLVSLWALILTFMRTGWIAVSVAFVALARPKAPPKTYAKFVQVTCLLLAGALFIGALFVRTHGYLPGINQDRSFWGRFAIWEVAFRSFLAHPLLGSGFGTYGTGQQQQLTDRLASFHPLNGEAKNLYLNQAVEFGLLGVSLLMLVSLHLYRTCDMLHQSTARAPDWLLRGIQGGLTAVAICGLFDTPILTPAREAATFLVSLFAGTLAALARDRLPVVHAVHKKECRYRSATAVGLHALGGVSVVISFWTAVSAVVLVQSKIPAVQITIARVQSKETDPTLGTIPEVMQDAVVTAEDENYYLHNGIDWVAIHRALRRDVRAMRMVQGGSTITMQAVRYVFLSEEKSIARKLAELYLADYLERRLTKGQILQMYISNVNFGMHSPGITRAARTYFDKSPPQLTLSESAFLAANLPNPIDQPTGVRSYQAETRRKRLVRRMGARYPSIYGTKAVQSAMIDGLTFAWEKRQLR